MPQPPVVDEVRARRLVVIDEEGNERIVADCHGHVAELRVVLPDALGVGTSGVSIVAGADRDLGEVLAVEIWAEGECRAGVSAGPAGSGWVVSRWGTDGE